MVNKYYKDSIIAGGAVRDANGKRINTTYATKEELSNVSAEGVKNQNGGETIKYWVGTKAEHAAQNIETEHPDWICTIVDDSPVIVPETETLIRFLLDEIESLKQRIEVLEGK